MRIVHDFLEPERFIAGTVGQPGERTFFLQAKQGRRTVAISLEKGQVAALASRIDELIEGVASGFDDAPLETPVVEEFRAGVLAISWNPESKLLTIEAQALSDEVDEIVEGDLGADLFRVTISAELALRFAARAKSVVAAGRAPCPFCSLPLDPQGHICPRANGYRR